LTSQRFYFPNGDSPQLGGAAADIVLPLHEGIDFKAERDLPHALAAETIDRPPLPPLPAAEARVDDGLLAALRAVVKERQAAWPEFALDRRREEVNRKAETRPAISVQLAERRAELAKDDATRDDWLVEYRQLMTRIAFRSSPVEAKAVAETLALHAHFARRYRPEGLGGDEGWRHGGVYFTDDSDGRLREVALEQIDFRLFEPQAAQLDAAFTRATGRALGPDAMAAVLGRLQRLETRTDKAVDAVIAAGLSPAEISPDRLRRGVDAVFAELTRLEPSLLYPDRGLDVAARQSLLLAADWAARRAEADSVPASSVAAPSISTP